MDYKKLPLGLEDFEKLITRGYYYIDKTMFIADLLHNWGKVNLFTRPRRFGKSLNISMLKSFFEIGSDKALFDGLDISREKELCEKYMGKFPVISLTMKEVSSMDYEGAAAGLSLAIGKEALRFRFLPAIHRTSGFFPLSLRNNRQNSNQSRSHPLPCQRLGILQILYC